MTAISKSWVTIADAAVDPDSPLDTTLMTGIRDDLVHLREWLGASYYAGAVQDHNHDGVNSKTISGAWVRLDSQTVSGAGSLNLITGFTSTYDVYVVHLVNLIPGNAARILQARVTTDGGSSWKSGGGDYEFSGIGYNSAGTQRNTANGGTTQIDLTENTVGVDKNANVPGLFGFLHIFQPADASYHKEFTFDVAYRESTTNAKLRLAGQAGYIGATTAINGIQLFYSSSDTISGTAHLYGVNKT